MPSLVSDDLDIGLDVVDEIEDPVYRSVGNVGGEHGPGFRWYGACCYWFGIGRLGAVGGESRRRRWAS